MRKLSLLAGAVFVMAASVWSFRQLGFWLAVEDPLARAAAIVVLAGDPPFRAIEGAALYRQGWAPEVWLVPNGLRGRDRVFAKLGIEFPAEPELNRAVLIRLGVPESAIHTLDAEALDTRDEVNIASGQLRRIGGSALIVATSTYHTRRVRMSWKALARPDQKLIVRPARQDGFRAPAWWKNTTDILAVTREVAGIANIWLGFPVRTRAN